MSKSALEERSTPPDDEVLRLGRTGRRRALAGVVVAILLAVGVWVLIGQASTYSRLLEALRHAQPGWLVLSLAASLMCYLGYALLYQAVARVEAGPRPPLGVTLRLTIVVFGTSVLATAAGRLGGEYWSLRRMREKPAVATARVLALNTAAWALLTGLAALGALVLLARADRHVSLPVTLAWVLALPVCVPPAAWLSSPKRRHLASDRGGRIRRTSASVVNSLVLLRSLMSRRALKGRGVAGGLLYWAGELLILWAALRAFGIALGPDALVVGYATGYVSTMLPLPAGGIGGVDAASTYALTLVGVPLGPALLAVVVQRAFSYWLPLAVAIAGGHFIRSLGGDLAAVPRPSPAGT